MEAARRQPGMGWETAFARLWASMLIYSSFLVKCWTKPDGTLSVQAEQVQSGEQFKGMDLISLAQWMESVRQRMVENPEAGKREQE